MLELHRGCKLEYFEQMKGLLATHKPMILCLVKTLANSSKLITFYKKFESKWVWAAIPARSYSGGIIVLLNCNVGKVPPLVFSYYSLHLVFFAFKHSHWILLVVYISRSVLNQKEVWNNLTILSGLDLPC